MTSNLPLVGDHDQMPVRPGRLRRHLAAHPRRIDITWAILYVAPAAVVVPFQLTVSEHTSGQAQAQSGLWSVGWDVGGHDTPAWYVGMVVALVVVVATTIVIATVRRHRPWLVFGLALACCIASWTVLPGAEVLAPSLALFGLAVYRSSSAAWRAMAIFGVLQIAGIWLAEDAIAIRITNAIWMIVFNLTVTAVSVNMGNQRRYLTALRERAEALARERDRSAQLAAAQERTRIAREMHDVVAHSLSVMVTLSDGAAAAVTRSPERAIEALSQLSSVGREATADMRRMLGVLRSEEPDSASREPQPNVGDLVGLCEQFRASGLPVHYSSAGIIAADSALQLAIYRIVQEALTNALRYADRPTAVHVNVVGDPQAVQLTVSDNGVGAPRRSPGGHGLMGMKERVDAYGGTLVAGPRSGGGWTVEACLPVPSSVGSAPELGPPAVPAAATTSWPLTPDTNQSDSTGDNR